MLSLIRVITASRFITGVHSSGLRFIRHQNLTSPSLFSGLRHLNMAAGSDEYSKTMYQLMENNNTKKFFIEYHGFMSNHVSHGLRALYKLGAHPSRAEQFIELHSKKLESAEDHKRKEKAMICPPEGIIGAKSSFYQLYDYYEQLLNDKYSGSLDKLVAKEFPKLSRGMIGSALHGMIHLGYGYESGLPWFVCEGLAYLHYCNLPINMSSPTPGLCTLGKGNKDILSVVEEIGKDSDLIAHMQKRAVEEEWVKKFGSGFQRKAGALFSERADAILQYVQMVKFPDHLNPDSFTKEQVPVLGKWLVDCALIVYAIAEVPNDFFLIHGVTCSWALKNIIHLLEVDQVIDATRTFLCTLFAAYLIQKSPRLNVDVISNNAGLTYEWADIIAKAINHDQIEEEHIYKLVQVSKCMSDENDDIAMEAIYRLAAYNCVSNPLTL